MTLPDLFFDPSKCLIGGNWQPAASGETLELTNPSDGTHLATIARGTSADIDAAVAAAHAARAGDWGRATAVERGRILTRLGQLVLEHTDTLAKLEALDVGKPLTQARNDVIALARYMEFYGGAADKVHGETIPYMGGYTAVSYTTPTLPTKRPVKTTVVAE